MIDWVLFECYMYYGKRNMDQSIVRLQYISSCWMLVLCEVRKTPRRKKTNGRVGEAYSWKQAFKTLFQPIANLRIKLLPITVYLRTVLWYASIHLQIICSSNHKKLTYKFHQSSSVGFVRTAKRGNTMVLYEKEDWIVLGKKALSTPASIFDELLNHSFWP